MKPAFLLLAAFAIGSCNQPSENQTLQSPKTGAPENKPATRKQCYEWKEKNSRAIASFTIQNDSVTGTLEYLFAEKDNSRGTIAGILRGDTIFADYTFRAEGRESVMEVIFLQQGDKLIQGHGNMRLQGAKMVYVQPNRVQFITGFKGKPCK